MKSVLELAESAKCTGCGACKAVCHKNAIKMQPNKDTGFLYPVISNELCVECELCKKICPILKEKSNNLQKEIFAAYSLNEDIRENSSSGGVFSLLAEKVINNGGVVFGVSMSEDCRRAEHIAVYDVNDIEKIRGSKYLQSDTKNSYSEAKRMLNENIEVLFSGTPCQIAGLKSFLGKDYDNLITVDFICHGVPSPKVWNKYVDFRESNAASNAKQAFFRDKKYGWKKYSVKFEFSNNSQYLQLLHKDLYMRGFISDLYLRPSCFNCEYKGSNYKSDITLADFWGIEKVKPKWNDDKGVSLFVINSNAGKFAFNQIKENINFVEVDSEEAFASNPSYFISVREKFVSNKVFKDFNNLPFDMFIEKYVGSSLKSKIIRKIHKFIVKIYRR